MKKKSEVHIRETVKIIYDIKTDSWWLFSKNEELGVRLRSEWCKHLTDNINQIISSNRGQPIMPMKEET